MNLVQHTRRKFLLLFSTVLVGTTLTFVLGASSRSADTIMITLLLFMIAVLTGIVKTTTA